MITPYTYKVGDLVVESNKHFKSYKLGRIIRVSDMGIDKFYTSYDVLWDELWFRSGWLWWELEAVKDPNELIKQIL